MVSVTKSGKAKKERQQRKFPFVSERALGSLSWSVPQDLGRYSTPGLAVCRPSISEATQLLISVICPVQVVGCTSRLISSVGPVHFVTCAQTSQWVRVMLAVRLLSQFIVLLTVSLWYRNGQDVRGPQSTVRHSIMADKNPVIGICCIHMLVFRRGGKSVSLLKGIRHESICGR